MRKILPIEWLALIAFAIALLLVGVTKVDFFYPDLGAISFTASHYLGPMVPALVLPLFAGMAYRILRQPNPSSEFGMAFFQRSRQTLALALIVLVHFNFKLWAQLLNPNRYDDVYQRIDTHFNVLLGIIDKANLFLATVLHLWPNAYHDIFVAMFIASFALHAIQTRTWIFDRVLFAVALVLIIGGLSYAIAPAWGPFIYGEGSNVFATEVQTHMIQFQRSLLASSGSSFSPKYFIAAVAAMPSLHIAHVMVLLWFAFRYIPVLGIAYLVPSTFLVTEAIASRWHYLADLPAGFLVAAVCILLSNVLIPNIDNQRVKR
ncbi:conserved membrane protein of unknown function [Georgfuchsia toluolica]|uniref:Inositolphosphotransferase Aur1/Ipt1 domain-containing protein n=1 Tax=Georgfuchsia toluolica TaxID=424218 RepID=A0A916J384_9PROT|nr:phosphatase PAP2 family protein [Georgfuchsia toluolica]CAG4883777.1 conserved membrane protein of unknown function [Georgfuchsia toluolica]